MSWFAVATFVRRVCTRESRAAGPVWRQRWVDDTLRNLRLRATCESGHRTRIGRLEIRFEAKRPGIARRSGVGTQPQGHGSAHRGPMPVRGNLRWGEDPISPHRLSCWKSGHKNKFTPNIYPRSSDGLMREFVPSEPRDLVLVSDEVCPPHLRVLVADDDESDRRGRPALAGQHLHPDGWKDQTDPQCRRGHRGCSVAFVRLRGARPLR